MRLYDTSKILANITDFDGNALGLDDPVDYDDGVNQGTGIIVGTDGPHLMIKDLLDDTNTSHTILMHPGNCNWVPDSGIMLSKTTAAKESKMLLIDSETATRLIDTSKPDLFNVMKRHIKAKGVKSVRITKTKNGIHRMFVNGNHKITVRKANDDGDPHGDWLVNDHGNNTNTLINDPQAYRGKGTSVLKRIMNKHLPKGE